MPNPASATPEAGNTRAEGPVGRIRKLAPGHGGQWLRDLTGG